MLNEPEECRPVNYVIFFGFLITENLSFTYIISSTLFQRKQRLYTFVEYSPNSIDISFNFDIWNHWNSSNAPLQSGKLDLVSLEYTSHCIHFTSLLLLQYWETNEIVEDIKQLEYVR